jgi:chemotaxis protein MotB
MADNKVAPIIIKKKKVSGGHGHHGGAWKVAYADFVTAMMAFFLVMWLMGSDEETKAAISHYFNHPNSPFKDGRDPASDSVHPMGERNGEGDTLLSGMDGLNPDDLVPNPVRSETYLEKYKEMAELLTEVMEGQAFGIDVNIDYLKFSVPESAIFKQGSSRFRQDADVYLSRVGRVLQGFKGYVAIEGHTDEVFLDGTRMGSVYEASIVKAVAVMDYLVDRNWIPEERVHPVGRGNRKKFTEDFAPQSQVKNRRIEFTLSYVDRS